MKKIILQLTIALLLVTNFTLQNQAQNQAIYPSNLNQLHQNVWSNIMSDRADLEEVEIFISDLKDNGSWSDIDYTSKQRGAWEPRSHISRLLEIAKAYQKEGTKYYHNTAISEKIHSGLNYWFENDFICPNWWYPEIGVPMVLAPVMILMEAELSPEQMQKGIKILDRSKIGMTGQNKVWQSGNVLM